MLRMFVVATAISAKPFGSLAVEPMLPNTNSTTPDRSYLQPIEVGGLWGYIDGSAKVVIKPVFESSAHFSEDLAPVKVGGLFGYICPSGTLAIAPQYDEARFFYKGIAPVRKGNK